MRGSHWEALEQLDLQLVWAQMLVEYRHGERWWLTPDEDKTLQDYNTRYEPDDPVFAAVARTWTAVPETTAHESAHGSHWRTQQEIHDALDGDTPYHRMPPGYNQRLGNALRKLGCAYKRGSHGMLYCAVRAVALDDPLPEGWPENVVPLHKVTPPASVEKPKAAMPDVRSHDDDDDDERDPNWGPDHYRESEPGYEDDDDELGRSRGPRQSK